MQAPSDLHSVAPQRGPAWARVDPRIRSIIEVETLPRLFAAATRQRGDAVAMRMKEYGIWQGVSWRQYGERARCAGLGLAALGVRRGEAVSIIAEGRPEWLYAEYGIYGIGAVCNGIYTTDSPAQVAYILGDSGSVVCIVENEEQLDKVLEVRGRCAALRAIVVIDMKGLHQFSDPMVISFADLLARGEQHGRAQPGVWEGEIEMARPEDVAVLIYTSGTTGPPKGVMLTHRNLVFKIENETELLGQSSRDSLLSFLPLSHIAERSYSSFFPLKTGAVVNFVESGETMAANLQELQPTILFAVPRVWEKFHSAVVLRMKEATLPGRLLYQAAIGLGYRLVDQRMAARRPPLALRAAYALASRVALENVRRSIGVSRCRYLVTGAAPIAPDVIKWYMALGLDMREAYGQTESAGMITCTPAGSAKLGTVGKGVPNVEVRLGAGGEILARGPNIFAGYLNQPGKSAETVVDGWLHTGDVGTIDEDGWVRVVDRLKDIIITAGGKNITPSEIENQLKFSPYISDAVVIGDRRKFLTCLIMVDQDNVAQFAQDNGVPFTSFASLCRARAVQDLVAAEIEKVNRNVARVETIKTFRLIEQVLTAEDAELTPTMKLKRSYVSETYRELIDEMYREPAV
ncbi:fatty-acid--CoA ligase [Chelatococcus reniformis]|uniref:Fatty-acid--CoA ligase n=2 Tax=Chelatococcus reniformis TaxID=1494448 RepID=A0A916UMS7_9HYPH|nr:fatty-acid--CoA ligase [Chelatococcus reniformis]